MAKLSELADVDKLWREYESSIFAGVDPSDIQRKETRLAFFSGMLALFCHITSDEFCSFPEETCQRLMKMVYERIRAEITATLITLHPPEAGRTKKTVN